MTTETTREHYTRLDAELDAHVHPDCGCQLVRNLDTGSVSLYQCPTHGAAPEMAELLKEVGDYGVCRAANAVERKMKSDKFEEIAMLVRALLRRLEG